MLPLSIVKVHLSIGRIVLPILVNIPLPEKRWTITGTFTIDLMEIIENHLKSSDESSGDIRGLEVFRDVIVNGKDVKIKFKYGVELDPLRAYSAYKAEVETNCETVRVCLEELLGFDTPLGGMEIANDPTPLAVPIQEPENRPANIVLTVS